MASADAFAVVNARGYSLVYIPASRVSALGISLSTLYSKMESK